MDFDISLLRSKTWLRGLGPAKAVDVEVEGKVEQLQVVGHRSKHLGEDLTNPLTGVQLNNNE